MAHNVAEIMDRVCDLIAEGQSLHTICRADDMPDRRTIMRWLEDMPEIRHQYTRARELQADKIFEECLAIADSQEDDVLTVDGQDVTNHDVIARAKLRIDTRKWMAGKLRPKVYGDKLDVVSSDGSLGPTRIVIEAAKPDDGSAA